MANERLADAITAKAKARRELAAYSRDTGIPKHGDLTRMDREIGVMAGDYEESARKKPERSFDR